MDDAALKTLLSADAPAAADPRFVVAVMARMEQRRFRRELAMTVGLTMCAMGLLALLAPTLEFAWNANFAPTSNAVIALLLAGVTLAVPYLFSLRND